MAMSVNNDSRDSEETSAEATKAAVAAHKFRYLLPPGSNFHFVARFRLWMTLSILLMAACVGALFVNKAVRGSYMNWTIDFKGGTEIIYAFHDKADPTKFVQVGSGTVRAALSAGGEDGFDVSEISWTDDSGPSS